MPRYDFKCRQCAITFEYEMQFGSTTLPTCPKCNGKVDKLIVPPAIHFKGDGFYNTDNKKKELIKEKSEKEKKVTGKSTETENKKINDKKDENKKASKTDTKSTS